MKQPPAPSTITFHKKEEVQAEGYKLGNLAAFKVDEQLVASVIGNVVGQWLEHHKEEVISAMVKGFKQESIDNAENAQTWNKLAESLQRVYDLSTRMKNETPPRQTPSRPTRIDGVTGTKTP